MKCSDDKIVQSTRPTKAVFYLLMRREAKKKRRMGKRENVINKQKRYSCVHIDQLLSIWLNKSMVSFIHHSDITPKSL